MHNRDFPPWVQKTIPYLPSAFRSGKMVTTFLMVCMVIVVLLVYAVVSPYRNATWTFVALAMYLVGLLLLVNYWGMTLETGVHCGMAAGALVLFYAIWSSGGIMSPRLAWLLILPVMPYFLIGRKEGTRWLMVVLLLQTCIALLTAMDAVPDFQLGHQHILTSFLTNGLVSCLLMIAPMIYDHMHRKSVAEYKQYQQALEDKRQELERALTAREQFIGTVSHELRTPMNAILGFNALLLKRVEGHSEARKVLDHTRQSADHLMTVINDILDYSQLQSGELAVHSEVFELRKTVEHAFELFLQRANSMNLDYRIEIDPALPQWVDTDRHRLTQILVNLLGNALKFTHQGFVLLQVKWCAPGVMFVVQDTGIGIAKELQAHIFGRFSQAHSDIQARYGGNGLGLAISKQLVTLLGGDIDFSSAPGEGSRFWFNLPLVACEAPVRKVASVAIELQTKNIAWHFLVVDDHPVNRLLVKQVLQIAWPNAKVSEAGDGQAALRLLEDQKTDLVLMDMVMPVMDGIEATRHVRGASSEYMRQVPILGLTANVNPLDLKTFEEAGLNAVMLKPFESAQLCTRVEQLLLERR